MKNLGSRIKKYRSALKMTQADLAHRLGITGAAVSSYENGSRLPSYEVLVKLSNILGVTTDELLGCAQSGTEHMDVSGLTSLQKSRIAEHIAFYKTYNAMYTAADPETKNTIDRLEDDKFRE